MLGVSHGALQFMTYEEMKNAYNIYRKLPIDSKLVRKSILNFKFRQIELERTQFEASTAIKIAIKL